MAGVVTDVCVAFLALSGLSEDFEVFLVTDASGIFSQDVRDVALLRMQGVGASCPLLKNRERDVPTTIVLLLVN